MTLRHLLTGPNTFLAALVALNAIMLVFAAIGEHEYSYYTFLRILTSYTAIALALSIEQARFKWLRLPLFGALITYNPISPIYLHRTHWQLIDLIAAALLLGAIYPALLPRDSESPKPHSIEERISGFLCTTIDSIGWLFKNLFLTSGLTFTLAVTAFAADEAISISIRTIMGMLVIALLLDGNQARKLQSEREQDLIRHMRTRSEK
jgi:hypothetical protein